MTDLDAARTTRRRPLQTPFGRAVSAPGGGAGGRRRTDRLARALGLASAGLGVPPLVSPGGFARALGVGDTPRQRAAVTAVGVRELVAAAALLRRGGPAWLWARVGGDAMDLALLTRSLRHHDRRVRGRRIPGRRDRARRERTVAATVGVVAITAIDLYAAVSRTRSGATLTLTATTTVARPPDEVYAFWRRLDNLPAFMAHLDEVRVTGETTSHWRASAPFGRSVEWDAEITDDEPGTGIAWRSTEAADVPNTGAVRFVPAPGEQGTEVHVEIAYRLPAGALGAAVARYFGEEPHQQLDDDLRRFKQVMETGEVVRSDGAPGGKRARREFPQRPARPLSAEELAALTTEETGA